MSSVAEPAEIGQKLCGAKPSRNIYENDVVFTKCGGISYYLRIQNCVWEVVVQI